jgi:thioredoxin-like negative regulator of GroEL
MQPSKSAAAKSALAAAKTASADLAVQPGDTASSGRLFRPMDWLTFVLVTLFVLAGYMYTVAPDLTLEDSGELAVGSMYAGVPHPPGYPVWTIYSWLFTKLLPFSNMAWRVAVSSAVAASLSAGLTALLISRGSSLIIEGMEMFRGILDKRIELGPLSLKTENAITFVAAWAGGALLGFNGFIWSQGVIVEVYTLAVLNLVGMFCLILKWMYQPDKRRYLYWAFFLFGLCLCNHQTLIVAAMGIEVAIAAADRKLGRDFFLGNTLVWAGGLALKLVSTESNPAVFIIFNIVGLGSLITFVVLLVTAPKSIEEWIRDVGVLVPALGAVAVFFLLAQRAGAGETGMLLLALALAAALLAVACWVGWTHRHLQGGMLIVAGAGVAFVIGAAFYFYMPIASASNPPMNWGYPRTWEGFVHAFTRGQYEKTTPTSDVVLFLRQVQMYAQGAKEEFNWANLLIGLVPFAFIAKMRRRERAWLIGLSAIYVCLAFLLLVLLNPQVDRSARELVKVFFTSSHTIIALAVGYGLSLIAALLVMHHDKDSVRWSVLGGAAVVTGLNLFEFVVTWFETEFAIFKVAAGLSVVLSLLFALWVLVHFQRMRIVPILFLFALIPFDSILSHWRDNEQRGHLFGFWFGHDMFEPGMNAGTGRAPVDTNGVPLYPPMTRDAVLYGGTDPGRFCPTYMIFAESFTPPQHRRNPKFDRRDVYIITQNALADNTYLDYIRAHYNRSDQYKYDLPLFYGMLNDVKSAQRGRTNMLATLFAPVDGWIQGLGASIEQDRRAGESLFKVSHFRDFAAISARIQAGGDPLAKFLKDQVGSAASSAGALAEALNKLLLGPSLFDDPTRFNHVNLSAHVQAFARQNPPTPNRIRLNRLLLESAFPGLIEPSPGGLYPDREILCPTPEDAGRCFQEYTADAARRYQSKQLRPGEQVIAMPDGRISVSGQVAVMQINGLLTKVIFDKNPNHEFFIEESFPLDWMYPHLVPYGIIMKIERNPVAEITEEMVLRDHLYWSQYSERFIGNWVTYETPVKELCEWTLRTYKRSDLKGFTGDPAFVRDDNAQKAFSKLRNAIGKSIYTMRINTSKTPVEQQRMIKEAEFALKQAFAFCPYSPETVFNYAQLLATLGRYEDAWLIADTCYQFDEDNAGVRDLRNQLESFRRSAPSGSVVPPPGGALPTDPKGVFDVASVYFQSGRSNDGIALLDTLLTNPATAPEVLRALVDGYAQLQRVDKVESALSRFTASKPDMPEGWYDLAAVRLVMGKASDASAALAKALTLSDARLKQDPAARDLRKQLETDPRLAPLKAAAK